MRETDLQQQVLSGLNDPNPEVQRAAVRVSLEHFLADPQTSPLSSRAEPRDLRFHLISNEPQVSPHPDP